MRKPAVLFLILGIIGGVLIGALLIMRFFWPSAEAPLSNSAPVSTVDQGELSTTQAPLPTASAPVAQSQVEQQPTQAGVANSGAGPTIGAITTNIADYADSQIPRYEKFEIIFQVDTLAENLQFPYDAAPPNGLRAGTGISVDAVFTPDNWQTTYSQPAFYYQEFLDRDIDGRSWLYPTAAFSWRIRFTPDEAGEWQFKLMAQDAGGLTESETFGFTVGPSTNKGFIKVSESDPRYFEFDDNSYFPALGYNFGIPPDRADFRMMSDNGIQLIRSWLPSQLAIFGAAWSPWRSFNPIHNPQEPLARLVHDGIVPFASGVEAPVATANSEVSMWLSQDETVSSDGNQWEFAPCMVLGAQSAPLSVKQDTNYRVRVRFKEQALAGPKISGFPYGFTVKAGGWLWDNEDETFRCNYPETGELLAATFDGPGNWSHYPDPENQGWQILEGHFNSGDRDFIELFYVAIENASAGHVFVDYVWLEENLGGGRFGPNIMYKAWMAHHQYFDQLGSYRFDQTVDLAEEYDLYMKLVILEKQDFVLNIFEADGTLSSFDPDENPNEPFFGDGRETSGKTKVRWLQEAWWRYLQARWGYSPHIHSWELLNEGDPFSTAHYTLTDEFGKYLQESFIPAGQARKHPNMHLVTTSFWHSFPEDFWGSEDYPYVDYADIHHYAQESNILPLDYIYELDDFYDAALFTQKLSMVHGAKQPDGPGVPVMRGETGFFFDDDEQDIFFANATGGVWLHNMIWAGINPGGLIESLFYSPRVHYEGVYDHRPMFKAYYNFIRDIPLNNGSYQAAEAVVSQPELRVWGQKDELHGRAHLWIQNKSHTWKNVLDGTSIPIVSGTVTVLGFKPGASYTLQEWDPYQPNLNQQIIGSKTLMAQADGSLTFPIENLSLDLGVKIFPVQ